jgi:anti-sigma regulatory factor (Ser/Thr protein kinase)
VSMRGGTELSGAFEHRALFYRDREEYRAAVLAFLWEGIAASQPVLIAVPAPHIGEIQSHLAAQAAAPGSFDEVGFFDMASAGRNPSRVIPAIRRFADAHPGRRTRFLGEHIWPGRAPPEVREATRHEALVNAAFSGLPLTVLCPYDCAGLPGEVLDDACRTHPVLVEGGEHHPSPAYSGFGVAAAIAAQALPDPPAGAQAYSFKREDLPRLRRYVERHAGQAGLPGERVRDLVVAVNEVTTNTVVHAKAAGVLHLWCDGEEVVCEVSDPGHISDLLAGRYLPSAEVNGGQGLWLVNQVCDLVEQRSGAWGTTIRIHMRRG